MVANATVVGVFIDIQYLFRYYDAEVVFMAIEDNPAIGGDALAHIDSFLTPAEIAESNLQVALIGELIKARNEQGISQKRLEEMSGVKQAVIARMERGYTSPQLKTILKVLASLGKTLAVVPLKPAEQV